MGEGVEALVTQLLVVNHNRALRPMKIFNSESELLDVLDQIEANLATASTSTCIADQFTKHYNEAWDLYGVYALDGHESDDEEFAMLEKHAKRITNIELALQSASNVCAEEDAIKESYIQAGRYGPNEAVKRLSQALLSLRAKD